MRLRVDLVPRNAYQGVVVIVDVLRATTTAPLLLSNGLETLYMTPSLRSARGFAAQGQHLLIGERDGLPPEGFHYGASPADLSTVDFTGKTAVMTTQNGPRTLSLMQEARAVLLGSFYNARAVTNAALELARELDVNEIAIVCAGQEGLESLDDTLCAGFLARRIERALQAEGQPLEYRDAAQLAIHLLRAFPDPQEALILSAAGQLLQQLGLHEDIAFGSLISQTEIVPRLMETISFDPEPVYRVEAVKMQGKKIKGKKS
jgi:2-phosphosulfolactate phosphatase